MSYSTNSSKKNHTIPKVVYIIFKISRKKTNKKNY